MDRNKIIKLLVILAAIVVFVGVLSRLVQGNSMSLSEYAASKNPSGTVGESSHAASESSTSESFTGSDSTDASEGSAGSESNAASQNNGTGEPSSTENTSLVGASLNGNSVLNLRSEYAQGFYIEPLSDNLLRYMTGVSYPANMTGNDVSVAGIEATDTAATDAADTVSFDELRYVHILHYNFDGIAVEGELVCNQAIAPDLVEIFYELYQNEYQLGSVLLIDEFDGDLSASSEANNSFCFYYSSAEADSTLSKHSLGLAVDINPLYNPQLSYDAEGTETISPKGAGDYADRSVNFPYKIDENDLCYKLFIKHGFVWGGNRNHEKAYGHFHKNL